MLKFNFESNTRLKCFWREELRAAFSMKVRLGWITFNLSLKIKLLLPFSLGQDWKTSSTDEPICLFSQDLCLIF